MFTALTAWNKNNRKVQGNFQTERAGFDDIADHALIGAVFDARKTQQRAQPVDDLRRDRMKRLVVFDDLPCGFPEIEKF